MSPSEVLVYNFHFLLFALALSVSIVVANLDHLTTDPPPFVQGVVIFAFFEGLYWGGIALLDHLQNL
ncbi:MAG: hypothetical protein ACPG30_07355 [Parvibaculales bacterium]